MKNDILDKAVAAVQNHEPDPAAVDAAVQRVGDAITSPVASSPLDETPLVLRGCADIQALVPAFVAGKLAPARALLVEDHTRSCVPCRRALKAVRSGLPVDAPAAAAAVSARRRPVAALALAASLLLCTALGA
ncbi:MAG: zf-HC2 domain-containing protein, partial [Deltaproteobacteria bacterium]|nr:zf-HC2 domain-containing protein [Deltaproteobacteria bacterium]